MDEKLVYGLLSRRYQLQMSSGTLHRVASFLTDVAENISPPSSGFLRVTGFSETSVRTRSTHHKVREGIYNLYRRGSIPEDSVL
jgi:hypothetical protein